ncbi:MAG: hypothetical protein BWY71_00881 [Planctomycetes bacterium ADurb.Bin412]|nr:MAG: hypothetical protein BWY71_00881 [Planctomycetes bacterium ADurb.Bin412]
MAIIGGPLIADLRSAVYGPGCVDAAILTWLGGSPRQTGVVFAASQRIRPVLIDFSGGRTAVPLLHLHNAFTVPFHPQGIGTVFPHSRTAVAAAGMRIARIKTAVMTPVVIPVPSPVVVVAIVMVAIVMPRIDPAGTIPARITQINIEAAIVGGVAGPAARKIRAVIAPVISRPVADIIGFIIIRHRTIPRSVIIIVGVVIIFVVGVRTRSVLCGSIGRIAGVLAGRLQGRRRLDRNRFAAGRGCLGLILGQLFFCRILRGIFIEFTCLPIGFKIDGRFGHLPFQLSQGSPDGFRQRRLGRGRIIPGKQLPGCPQNKRVIGSLFGGQNHIGQRQRHIPPFRFHIRQHAPGQPVGGIHAYQLLGGIIGGMRYLQFHHSLQIGLIDLGAFRLCLHPL